jgi:hypothetical protein
MVALDLRELRDVREDRRESERCVVEKMDGS